MKRIPELDALRGIAAAMVFIHHVQVPGMHPATLGLDVGVLLFFSLSGFLLYVPFATARDSGRSVRTLPYLIRRVLRIYPAYFAAVVGGAIVYGWRPESVVGVITMSDSPIFVAWTLRIEVVFYLLLPVIAFALTRVAAANRLRALLALGIGSLAIGAAELALARQVPISVGAWMFAFVPGMLLGELYARGHPLIATFGQARWLGVGIVLLVVSAIPNVVYPDLTGAIGSGLLVAWCVAAERLGSVGCRAATVAGALSYGVYLWHVPVIDALNRPTSVSGVVVSAIVTLVIASVTYVAIEAPGIRLGQSLARAVGHGRRPVSVPARAES